MVAINFKEEFAWIIRDGSKRQTIRQKARCKVGDTLQLYTGQRTKSCKKISDAKCHRVTPIQIGDHAINIGGCALYDYEMARFVRLDGFIKHQDDSANINDFFSFFEDHYELPFSGFLIEWKLEKVAA